MPSKSRRTRTSSLSSISSFTTAPEVLSMPGNTTPGLYGVGLSRAHIDRRSLELSIACEPSGRSRQASPAAKHSHGIRTKLDLADTRVSWVVRAFSVPGSRSPPQSRSVDRSECLKKHFIRVGVQKNSSLALLDLVNPRKPWGQ